MVDLYRTMTDSSFASSIAATNIGSTSPGGAGGTLSGIISTVFKNDTEIRGMMTQVEQSTVDAIINRVGTPDDYPDAATYILKALPYVKGIYGAADPVTPSMPSDEEVAILMLPRFISAA